MSDTFITVICILLAAVLLLIFPLITMADRIDTATQSEVNTLTNNLVDEIRETGKLTSTRYHTFLQELSATGNTYDVNMEIKILDENPGKKTTQAERDKIGENVYYSIYTTQIEDELDKPDGEYVLKEGDLFSITVRNTNLTLTQQLKNFMYTVAGNDTYTIASSSSGLVKGNGNATVISSGTGQDESSTDRITYILREGGEGGKILATSEDTNNEWGKSAGWTNKNIYAEFSSADTYELGLEYYWRLRKSLTEPDIVNDTKLASNTTTYEAGNYANRRQPIQAYWKSSGLEKYSDVKEINLKIDTISPTISSNTSMIYDNGSNHNIGNTATLTFSNMQDETNGSGLSSYAYTYVNINSTAPDPSSITNWVSFGFGENSQYSQSSIQVKTEANNNNKTCYFWVKDNAGNISQARTIDITGLVPRVTGATLDDQIVKKDDIVVIEPNLEGGTQYESIEFTSSDPDIADVDPSTGKLIIKQPGTVEITCTITNYDGTKVEVEPGNGAEITIVDVTFNPNGGNYLIPDSGSARINTTVKVSGISSSSYAWSNSATQTPTQWTNDLGTGKNLTTNVNKVSSNYLWVRLQKYGQTIYYVSNNFNVRDDKIRIVPSISDKWTNQNIDFTIVYPDSTVETSRKAAYGSTLVNASTNSSNAKAPTTSLTVTANGYIYAVAQDAAGNQITATYQITNIDKNPPTVTLSPNGGNYAMPTTGNARITTKISATDTGGSGLNTLQYAWSTSRTAEPSSGWTTFKNGETLSKTDITSPGTWYLWTRVTDVAGNRAEVIKVSNAFTISASASLITITPDKTTWTNQNVIGTVTYGNTLTSGKKAGYGTTLAQAQQNASAGTATRVTATQNGYFYAEATDVAGNKVTKSLQITNIDKEKPVLSNITNSTNGNWTNGSVTLSWTITEKLSGINRVEYSLNGTTWNSLSKSEWYGLTRNNQRDDTLYIRVIDNATNVSDVKTTRLRIDKTKPTVTLTAISGANSKNITITVADTGGSGLSSSNSYQYYLATGPNGGGGSWTNYTSGKTFTIGAGKTGSYYLFVKRISDNASNISTAAGSTDTTLGSTTYHRFGPYTFDNIAPTCKVTANVSSPTNASSITYTFTFSEDVTGFTADDITVTNGTKGKLDAKSGSVYTMTVSNSGSCTQTVSVAANVCTDLSGNKNIASNILSITIDRTAPTCTVTANRTSPTNSNSITYTFTFSENVTGFTVDDITVTNGKKGTLNGGGKTYTLTVTNSGSCTQTVSVAANVCTDSSGNGNAESNKLSILIDRTLPTVTLSPNGGTYTMPTSGNAKISTTLTASDSGGSGLNILQYAWSTSRTTEPTSWTTFKSGETVTKSNIARAGTWYLWTKVTDKAGNRADVVKTSNAFVINANTTSTSLITITASPEGWTNGNVTGTVTYGSTLTSNKKAGFGTTLALAQSNAKTNTATTVTATSNGYFYAEATDAAGNKVTKSLQITNIDKLQPESFTPGVSGQYTQKFTISASTSDAAATTLYGASGMETNAYRYSIDGGSTYTSWLSSKSHQFTGLSPGTTYNVKVQARDKAGNIRTESTTATTLPAVAQISTTYYASVQDAFDAAKGTTNAYEDVTLLVDRDESSTLASGKYVDLNLNGKNLKSSTHTVITNNGSLTLSNGKMQTTYTAVENNNYCHIYSGNYSSGSNVIVNYKNMDISGGTITCTGATTNAIQNMGTCTISGTSSVIANADAITTYNSNLASNNLTITGGTIRSDGAVGIIVGGYFNGRIGGQCNISGGNISGYRSGIGTNSFGSGSQIKISGGRFTGHTYDGISDWGLASHIEITGGYFIGGNWGYYTYSENAGGGQGQCWVGGSGVTLYGVTQGAVGLQGSNNLFAYWTNSVTFAGPATIVNINPASNSVWINPF